MGYDSRQTSQNQQTSALELLLEFQRNRYFLSTDFANLKECKSREYLLSLKDNLLENKNNTEESRTKESIDRFLPIPFEYVDLVIPVLGYHWTLQVYNTDSQAYKNIHVHSHSLFFLQKLTQFDFPLQQKFSF